MLTSNQLEVLEVVNEFGPLPDVALVPLAQHVVNSHQSSSGIRSRRAELERQGYLIEVGTRPMPSGRDAAIHDITYNGVDVLSEVRNAGN